MSILLILKASCLHTYLCIGLQIGTAFQPRGSGLRAIQNYEASVTRGRGPSEAITWLFSVSPVYLYSSRPKVSRVFGWGTTQNDDVLLGGTSFFIVFSLRLLRLGHDPSIITFDHRCS